jgi:hypothetical protein
VIAGAVAACLPLQAASAGLTFTLTPTGNAQADAGFAAASARWSAVFDDDITVNITAQFAPLNPPNVIGQTSVVDATYSYGTLVRPALVADATTADDASSTAALQAGASVNLLINRTSDNPNANKATPYLDNDAGLNNNVIRVTRANAKAIGLVAAHATGSDATISFNSALDFDFNPADGIDNDKLDFIGVATHELGHALGFISGIETLDALTALFGPIFGDNEYNFVRTMDLFRFSPQSLAHGIGVPDWTADTRDKFFSVDGGANLLDRFSTGVNFGDGRQNSHWKDDLGIGLMDPTTDFGDLMSISGADLRVLDIVGFDLVPEPAVLPALVAGLLTLRRPQARSIRLLKAS